ncbi:MAG: S41 family peptidase [Bacteroidota bacterium]
MRCLFLIWQIFLWNISLSASPLPEPVSENDCQIIHEFLEILDNNHVDPPEKDLAWADRMSALLIEGLDPRALYLSQQDEKKIRNLNKALILDLENNSCNYLAKLKELFEQRLTALNQSLLEWEKKALVYSSKDTISWVPGAKAYRPFDFTSLKSSWKNRIKYLVLYSIAESEKGSRSLNFGQNHFDLQIKEIRRARCEIEQIQQAENGFEEYFLGKFMDALSASYDPHSGYFSLSEKELWDLALSTEAFSFGLEFEKSREGQLQVSKLNPGGPAWKSQLLHKGDEILELEYPKGSPLDLNCLSISQIANQLKDSRSRSMALKIKKRNGEIRKLSLQKEKLETEENIINSFLLEGDKKLGYIYLPAFYTDSEDEISKGCAEDVARELLRLQAEGISGLILDLRFNGGGSMKEAIDLAGIFIDRGPMAIFESREKDATLLRDMNRGSFYEGPLVVLINGHSASASEILASALQDYERAVIVGSQSFGKSSGQIMLPVVGSGLGMAKVSIQKYYRINGDSYQLNGVVPDVVLPTIDQVLGQKERDYLSPLTHKRIEKKTFYEKAGSLPYAYLEGQSESRIDDHEGFRSLNRLLNQLRAYQEKGLSFILAPREFKQAWTQQMEVFQMLSNSPQKKTDAFIVRNNRFVESLLKLEPDKVNLNTEQKDKIYRDMYIEEAYFILSDLIQQEKP